jgi:hypothetical protein
MPIPKVQLAKKMLGCEPPGTIKDWSACVLAGSNVQIPIVSTLEKVNHAARKDSGPPLP